MLKATISALSLLLLSHFSYADILVDTSGVYFCHDKEIITKTITVTNTDSITRKIDISHLYSVYGDGYTLNIDQCIPTGEAKCPMTLAPGKSSTIAVTMRVVATDQYSKFEILDGDNADQKLFDISLGASDMGGCWDNWNQFDKSDAKVIFNHLVKDFSATCEVDDVRNPNKEWCSVEMSKLFCDQTNGISSCKSQVFQFINQRLKITDVLLNEKLSKELIKDFTNLGLSNDNKVAIGRIQCEKDPHKISSKYFCKAR